MGFESGNITAADLSGTAIDRSRISDKFTGLTTRIPPHVIKTKTASGKKIPEAAKF
jgi:hypothetical protein